MYCLKNNLFSLVLLSSFIAIPLTSQQLAAEETALGIKPLISSNAIVQKGDEIAERSKKGYRDGLKYRGYQRNSNDRYDRYDRHDRYDKYYDRYDRTFDRYSRYNAGGFGLGLGLGGLGIRVNAGAYDYPVYYNRTYYYSPSPYSSNVYVYPDESTYYDNYYYVYPTDAIYYYDYTP